MGGEVVDLEKDEGSGFIGLFDLNFQKTNGTGFLADSC